MRGANELSGPTLAQSLILPNEQPLSGRVSQHGSCNPRRVLDDWSMVVGGRPVVMVRNLDEARRQLLQTLDVAEQETVLLPANATHSLVEVVKRSGAKSTFGNLDQELRLCSQQQVRIAWSQPPLGLPIKADLSAEFTVLDHGDSVPARVSDKGRPSLRADVTIFGLHLSTDPQTAGALLVFNSELLHTRFLAGRTAVEPALYTRAARQLQRLQSIAARQASGLKMVSLGLETAAGLPVLPVLEGAALAHGVAVRIPDEGSPSTFWTYASSENTPADWLPRLRPLHYAATLTHLSTAAFLERWLVVPVSPDNDEEMNRWAVLGIVKAAEYMGLRWRTDPARAAQYAALLNSRYGLDHDAFRPAFPIDANLPDETLVFAEAVSAPSCRL